MLTILRMEEELYEISVMQRGLLQKLINRGKPIEKEVLLAIMGLQEDKIKNQLPTVFSQAENNLGQLTQILPNSLYHHLCAPLLKIKSEP